MIKCMLVDDEPLARQILETYIAQTDNIERLASCANAFEAFEQINKHRIDLLFLDIELPSLSGIEFIRSLKEPPAIIFTTAYPDYAVQSYELEAVDYLLKPITYERFKQSINRFQKSAPEKSDQAPYTYFKVNGELIKVLHIDILYARSLKDYIIIKTVNGQYITHMTMKALVSLLPAPQFNRVHRSFMVNKHHITAIGKSEIRIGKHTIPIGDSYRPDII